MQTPSSSKQFVIQNGSAIGGTEPHELLESAHVAQTGQAVGRFAHFAAESIGNPLMEMHATFISSLVDRSVEQRQLEVGAQHGPSMAQLTKNAPAALLVAANAVDTLETLETLKMLKTLNADNCCGRSGNRKI